MPTHLQCVCQLVCQLPCELEAAATSAAAAIPADAAKRKSACAANLGGATHPAAGAVATDAHDDDSGSEDSYDDPEEEDVSLDR